MYSFTIEGRLPSLNDYTKACRGNKFAGAKMKKDAEDIIGLYILSAKNRGTLPRTPIDKEIWISYKWYEKDMKRDADNIVFAQKFIQDALTHNGIIVDDTRKYITGFSHEILVDKQKPRIEVKIEFRENTD